MNIVLCLGMTNQLIGVLKEVKNINFIQKKFKVKIEFSFELEHNCLLSILLCWEVSGLSISLFLSLLWSLRNQEGSYFHLFYENNYQHLLLVAPSTPTLCLIWKNTIRIKKQSICKIDRI
jgi:hypothetical protein